MTTQTPAVIAAHIATTHRAVSAVTESLDAAVSALAYCDAVSAEDAIRTAKAKLTAAAVAARRLTATVNRVGRTGAEGTIDVAQVLRFVGYVPVAGREDPNADAQYLAAGLTSEQCRINRLPVDTQIDILALCAPVVAQRFGLTPASRPDLALALRRALKAATAENLGDAVDIWLHSDYVKVPGVVELLRR